MPAGKPATPLCDQFGFDTDWRAAQLTLAGLDAFNRDDVRELHDRVLGLEATTTIVDRFFQQVSGHPQASQLLMSFDIDHLRQRQVDFFRDFGVRFRESGYFESRARLGMAHARVGVPLSLYLAGFCLLQALVIEEIDRQGDPARQQKLRKLVLALTSLDVALATEVFQRAGLESSRVSAAPAGPARQLEQDALTGVSSRTSLLRELASAMQRSSKTGQPLVVIQVDPDRLKDINDRHGHPVGDKVLCEVAARIKAALREFDLVGRYGGEEFVILLENTSLHTANQVAERIRQRIASAPLKAGKVEVELTVSQGLAQYREDEDCQGLLQRVQQAMEKAKLAGRNSVAEA